MRVSVDSCVCGVKGLLLWGTTLALSLYTILQLPILRGIYCDNGGSGGNVILRNSASDDGVGWGT